MHCNGEVKIMDHLNDEDERKILVEGCEHCRHTGWVVVGIAAMVSASFHGFNATYNSGYF